MRLKRGGASGGVAVGVRLSQFGYPSDFPSFGSIGWAYDDITRIVSTSYLVASGVSQRVFFGSLETDSTATDIMSEGIPPRQSAYTMQRDVDKYSSNLGVAFDQPDFSADSDKTENQVFHTTLKGSVRQPIVPLYTYGDASRIATHGARAGITGFEYLSPEQEAYYSNLSIVWRYGTATGTLPTYNYSGGYVPVTYWYTGLPEPALGQDFYSLVKRLEGIEECESYMPYLGMHNVVPLDVHRVFNSDGASFYGSISVSDVSYRDGRLNWTCYNATGITTGFGGMCVTKNSVKLTPVYCDPQLRGAPSSMGRDIFDIQVDWKATVKFYSYILALPGSDYYGWDRLIGDPDHDYHRVYYLGSGGVLPQNFLFSGVQPTTEALPSLMRADGYIRQLDSYFAANLGFFRPAAMLSYADAVQDHRATTTNWVEVIAEAKELLNLMPDYRLLFQSASDIIKKRWLSGALKLGDLFSGTYLLKTFGWRPAVDNAREVTSKLDRYAHAISALQSNATFRGKKTFTLDALGYKNVRLTVRSKVRVGGMTNDFLIAFLRLDSLGLSPTSKNLWALKQWSWLIDIFLGMSTRYDVLDAVAIGLMIDMHVLVHSFLIEIELPPDLLAEYGLEADPSDPPTIKVYAREVSRVVPMIFDGYDYAAPTRPPDKGLIAALLWQLLRKNL